MNIFKRIINWYLHKRRDVRLVRLNPGDDELLGFEITYYEGSIDSRVTEILLIADNGRLVDLPIHLFYTVRKI